MSKQILDLFTGTANPELANEVAKILDIKISKADVGYFSDGEIKVQIEDNVRGHDTFMSSLFTCLFILQLRYLAALTSLRSSGSA